jgi:hypothetical protein
MESIYPDQTQRPPLCLAVELQPGPLSLLNSLDALKLFDTQVIEKLPESIKPRFGYNLDIGHFELADISPERFYNVDGSLNVIARRFAHCHCSDFLVKGHLCDQPMGSRTGPRRFAQWFSLLYQVACNRPPNCSVYPGYRNFISIEMEVARNVEQVISALHRLSLHLRQSGLAFS